MNQQSFIKMANKLFTHNIEQTLSVTAIEYSDFTLDSKRIITTPCGRVIICDSYGTEKSEPIGNMASKPMAETNDNGFMIYNDGVSAFIDVDGDLLVWSESTREVASLDHKVLNAEAQEFTKKGIHNFHH